MPPKSRTKTKMPVKSSNSAHIADKGKTNFVARQQFKTDILAVLPTILFMGIVFGFAMQKGQVYLPSVIRDQFAFRRFIMLKMFLSAAATSAISFAITSPLFPGGFANARKKWSGINNVWRTVIGSSLLGAGMACGGACPGMVLIQVGSVVQNSIVTVFGGLVGALVYGLIDPIVQRIPAFSVISWIDFADEIVPKTYQSFSTLAFELGVLLFSIVLLLEYLVPWKSELDFSEDYLANTCSISLFHCAAWPPSVAGIVVGSLQIPAMLVFGSGIGGSSAYVTAMSQWLRLLSENSQATFKHMKGKLNGWWQLTYVVCAIGGGLLSSALSHGLPLNAQSGTSAVQAFIGGFMMIFGSRMSYGCTSGHGLSGMGLLTVGSIIAVPCMFAAGILVTALFSV